MTNKTLVRIRVWVRVWIKIYMRTPNYYRFIHDTHHFKAEVISYRMMRLLFHLDEYRPRYLHLNSHALAKCCHATDNKEF